MTDSEQVKQVLHELKRLAMDSSYSVNELRVVLALERMVARIESHDRLREVLVFKGGFVLLKVLESLRYTRDLDALAQSISQTEVSEFIKQALSIDLRDGVSFGIPEFKELTEQGKYGGLRVKVPFQIGDLPREEQKLRKLSRIHLDIGFGDRLPGAPLRLEMSSKLDLYPKLSWQVYPLESIFAEKLETLVSRGSANSRAKDLYDLVMLGQRLGEMDQLSEAIKVTFETRSTKIPDSLGLFFEKLDRTFLEKSWKVVQLSDSRIPFEQVSIQLGDLLKQVDLILAGDVK